MTDGHSDTPYRKPSQRAPRRKGTGPGICQTTHEPHEFLKARSRPFPFYAKLYGWGRVTLQLPVAEVCVNCDGYRNPRVITGDTRKEVMDKASEWAGEPYHNILLTTEHSTRVK